jgi:protein TonB
MIQTQALNDRFAVSVMLALGLHAAVLMGIGFVLELNPLADAADTLDVVLVNFSSESEPDEADFLAQANQEGGGEVAEPARPSQELTSLLPSVAEGMMPATSAPAMAEPLPDQRTRLAAPGEQREVPEATSVPQPEFEAPSVAELMRQRMQVAQLQAQLRRDTAFESRLKRRRFISAATREYEFASYMQAWVSKVERVGNMNYPSEVRRRRLVGDLLLTVGINHDGSVESMQIRRSSGMPELDEAALRIVQLAAPFAPLPTDIRSQVDVLHITRTWKFSSGQMFH